MTDSIRIVLVSDTHLRHEFPVPAGDVLIHAGDGCSRGDLDEARRWAEFLASLPHGRKIVIAGNHDRCFESDPAAAEALLEDIPGLDYLRDSACELDGLPVWGSPWQPWFLSWAFNLQRGPELAAKWALIPEDTDLLVTHGPPQGILDETVSGQQAGCEELLAACERVCPRLHVFGHIHEGYGVLRRGPTLFVNASICTLAYAATNAAVVVDLPRDRSAPAVVVEP